MRDIKKKDFSQYNAFFSTTFFLCCCCLNRRRNWNHIVKWTKFSQLKCHNVTSSVTLWHIQLNLYTLVTKCKFSYLSMLLFRVFVNLHLFQQIFIYSLWFIYKCEFSLKHQKRYIVTRTSNHAFLAKVIRVHLKKNIFSSPGNILKMENGIII